MNKVPRLKNALKKLDKSSELFVPGSVGERSTASSCSTWRNIVQRCACASKIPTAIAITAASSRAKPWATPTASIQPRPRPPLSATPPPPAGFLFLFIVVLKCFTLENHSHLSTSCSRLQKKRIMWNRIAAFSHLSCARAKQIKKESCIVDVESIVFPKILIGQFTSAENVLLKQKKNNNNQTSRI